MKLTARKRLSLAALLLLLMLAAPLAQTPLLAQKKGKTCQVDVVSAFSNNAGDKVQGTGSYLGGSVSCDGKLLILFDHNVVYDMTDLIGHRVVTTGNLGVEGDTLNLLQMEAGDSIFADKIQFNFVDAATNTRYFLQFGTRYQAEGCANCSGGTITMVSDTPGARQWSISSEDMLSRANTARLLSCPARGKCTPQEVGTLEAPFELTITE
jgi:hypothetical protein